MAIQSDESDAASAGRVARARFYSHQIGEYIFRLTGIRRPRTRSYLVCATPRSGSGLLCDVLWRTTVAGRPTEYFRGWDDGGPAEPVTPEQLQRLLDRAAAYSSGVLGVKIMADQLRGVVERARTIPAYRDLDAAGMLAAIIPGARHIYISRRDKVRQAVSWAKAIQSGEWYEFEGRWRLPSRRKEQGIVYDFDQIARCYRSVAQQEAAWEAFFSEAHLQPYHVVYEEFVRDWKNATCRVLDYLEIQGRDRAVLWRHRRAQSDSSNAEWARRFTEDLERRESSVLIARD